MLGVAEEDIYKNNSNISLMIFNKEKVGVYIHTF